MWFLLFLGTLGLFGGGAQEVSLQGGPYNKDLGLGLKAALHEPTKWQDPAICLGMGLKAIL